MNFDEILKKFLDIADFPQDRKEEFVRLFYLQIFIKSFEEIRKIDPSAFQKIKESMQNESDTAQLNKVLEDLSKNQRIKEKIEKARDGVLSKLVDDVEKFATDNQKQQILASLPN